MASTRLYRTFGTPTLATKYTCSFWMKRCNNGAFGSISYIFNSYSDANNWGIIRFTSSDQLEFFQNASSSTQCQLITNRLFRDPGAWYHVVIAVDTTQGTPADRNKMYINGVQETSFATETNFGSSDTGVWNGAYVHTIGRNADSGGNYFDGLMAHFHWIDGLQYAASDFGETDSTSGIWVAKTGPSVTYGNNGCFLKFQDTAAYGDDSSGNTNDFTLAGTMTQTKDTPDNNFCTMNPLNNYLFNGTYSNGDNTVATDVKCWNSTTLGMTTGKWYWEIKIVSSTSGSDWTVGFAGKTATGANDDGGSTEGTDVFHYRATGAVWNNGSTSLTTTSYTTGDIISIALDLTNNKWYVGKNGTWLNSGDPTSGATGTGAVGSPTAVASTTEGAYFPSVSYLDGSQSGTFNTNFGNGYFGTTAVSTSESDDAGIGSFEYDVPAGYYALCTNNLGDQS